MNNQNMKSRHIIMSLAAVAVSVGITACVSAGGEKEDAVSMDKVPQAAKDALEQYASESDVKGVEKGDQDGTKVYEFDITQGARSFELAVTPDGKFMGTEENIQLTDMPEAAQAALKAQTGDGKLSGFEKAVGQNHKTTYEADIEKNGKKTEVAVDADGNVVSTESADKEKGDND
jgi:uncharacterized membrane protein YkoI